MKLKILALVVMLGIVGRADATYILGNALIPWCEGKYGAEGYQLCEMYLVGVHDATTTLTGEDQTFCVPEKVIGEQLRKVFVKYVTDNPQVLHASASSITILAITEAFPCQ
jgi:hypothetical protein